MDQTMRVLALVAISLHRPARIRRPRLAGAAPVAVARGLGRARRGDRHRLVRDFSLVQGLTPRPAFNPMEIIALHNFIATHKRFA